VSCASCPLGDCWGQFLHLPVYIGLLFSMLLIGRAFCGWACPLGYLQDILNRCTPRRLRKTSTFSSLEPSRVSSSGRRSCSCQTGPTANVAKATHLDPPLRWFKYGVLVLVMWWVYALNLAPDRGHPYVVRSSSVLNPDALRVAWGLGLQRYPVRAALLVVALASALVVPRAWCRYACPLGALLGLLGRISLLKIDRNMSSCSACGKFPANCPTGATPDTTECTICGDCTQACPGEAIHVGKRFGEVTPT